MDDPRYPGALQACGAASAVPVPIDGEGTSVNNGALLSPRARMAYVTPANQISLGEPHFNVAINLSCNLHDAGAISLHGCAGNFYNARKFK
jgi:hypothetical protein